MRWTMIRMSAFTAPIQKLKLLRSSLWKDRPFEELGPVAGHESGGLRSLSSCRQAAKAVGVVSAILNSMVTLPWR